MAAYKVIQDIEADDKFVGPLSLKQFIFAAITVVSMYISFLLITKNLWFLAIPFIPLIALGGFLAFPWGRDQPTEIWLLAKLRFLIKPRKRIWDQSGVQELVTITAPKRDDKQYVNNLTPLEVKSRLRALADTIDSRGWAVKNVNVNLYSPKQSAVFGDQFSDRLIDVATLPQEVPTTEVLPSDDIMDAQNNPLAQQLDEMINASSQTHRDQVMKRMDTIREGGDVAASDAGGVGMPPPNYWFINKPDPAQTPAGFVPQADPVRADNAELTAEEKALLDQLHKEQAAEPSKIRGHLKVIEPLSKQRKKAAKAAREKLAKSQNQPAYSPISDKPVATFTPPAPVTPMPDPAILALALNNDRDVASLAREANKPKQPDEVVIRLH